MKTPSLFKSCIAPIVCGFVLSGATTSEAALVAKWSFDEGSGSTVADGLGSYHGTLSPTGASFVPDGISGGAISLNRGANGYVTMGNVLPFMSGDYSLVAWIKMAPGDLTPDGILLGKHAAFSRNGYYIHINQSSGLPMQSPGKAFFYQGGSGVSQIQASETPVSTTSINDGNWHQVVAVFKAGGEKKIYVNGAPAEDSKVSQVPSPNSAPFMIGGISVNGQLQSRLTALVDEVQIYDHVLTDDDVDFLYQNPTGIVLDPLQSLQAQLAQANLTIANLQAEIANNEQRIEELEEQLASIDSSLQRLTSHLRKTFRYSPFVIPGSSTAAQVDSVVSAIEGLNRGALQNVYQNLGGR